MAVDIDTYSDDGNLAAPGIAAGFNQDTRDLAISDENVIGPFDGCGNSTGFKDRVNDGKRSNHYEKVGREMRPEYGGPEDIASRHVYPTVTLPALSHRLSISK